jgi:hypothetical protein
LLAQLGVPEAERPEEGPHATELAATISRTLAIPEIAARRSRLIPEMTVFSAAGTDAARIYVGGVADAVAYDANGAVELVIDWKSDVNPSARQIELYQQQIRDYLAATGAPNGLLVFVTPARLLWIR